MAIELKLSATQVINGGKLYKHKINIAISWHGGGDKISFVYELINKSPNPIDTETLTNYLINKVRTLDNGNVSLKHNYIHPNDKKIIFVDISLLRYGSGSYEAFAIIITEDNFITNESSIIQNSDILDPEDEASFDNLSKYVLVVSDEVTEIQEGFYL